jgi:hypothetical protein
VKHFNWLHFTDLHCGQQDHEWLWPTFQKLLFDDLNKLNDSSLGPWDLVLFSGDLTQSATFEQFEQVTQILQQIRNHLLRFQCDPVFVCVPGNHDISRPLPTSSVVKTLSQWHKQPDIRNLFWSSEVNEYRQTVKECFTNYQTWWDALPLPKPANCKPGILIGDSSCVIERSGISIGVVGLNSAFLQLTDDNYEGQLDLHQRQLLAVCNNSPDAWCAELDIALLMTHHGHQWLQKKSIEHFQAEIYPPGRFFAHLCGHLHEPDMTNISKGGAADRRFRQGPSLFGLKNWGKDKKERIHGYIAGQFELTNESGVERIWPRRLAKKLGGHWGIGPDVLYDLSESNSVETPFQSGRKTAKAIFVTDVSTSQVVTQRDQVNKGIDTSDNFGMETSFLGGGLDPDVSERKLKKIARFKMKAEPHHLSIRQTEQMRFFLSLVEKRCTWLFADWGLGKEPFLACIMEKLSQSINISDVYLFNCDEVNSFEDFEPEVARQFRLTIQEFCALNAGIEHTILIIDEAPYGLYDGNTEDTDQFDRLISSIADFCPHMLLIITARQLRNDIPHDWVELRPLDLAETANYVVNHLKAGPELNEANAIDELYMRSEGLPMHLDRLFETLQITSLRDLVNYEIDTPLDCISAKEPIPRALRRAVAILAQSTEKYTRRSYRMLKVLSILPDGATLQGIRRLYPTEPFHPRNALELINFGLLKAETGVPEYGTPEITEQAAQWTDDKTLVVPRQVRDYVRSNLTDEEHIELVKSLATLLFGEGWREGITKAHKDKAAALNPKSKGPGNEHSVGLRLLRNAIDSEDAIEITRALDLAVSYCSSLKNASRYRDARIATEDILAVIKSLAPSKQYARLSLIRAESLRMLGDRERALDTFNEVLDYYKDFLSKSELADSYVSVALAHSTNKDGALAVDAAQKVQSMSNKGSSMYHQAQAIIIGFRESDPGRRTHLKELEKRARQKDHTVVANNIALSLVDAADDENEKLSLLNAVLGKKMEDPYNGIRAVIRKANYLTERNKYDQLSLREQQLLIFAYSYLFCQRLTTLFASCHQAIWKILAARNDIVQLLRIFRLSSFLWRIRGKDDLEKRYISYLEELDLSQLRRLTDKGVQIDLDYLDRRIQKALP